MKGDISHCLHFQSPKSQPEELPGIHIHAPSLFWDYVSPLPLFQSSQCNISRVWMLNGTWITMATVKLQSFKAFRSALPDGRSFWDFHCVHREALWGISVERWDMNECIGTVTAMLAFSVRVVKKIQNLIAVCEILCYRSCSAWLNKNSYFYCLT